MLTMKRLLYPAIKDQALATPNSVLLRSGADNGYSYGDVLFCTGQYARLLDIFGAEQGDYLVAQLADPTESFLLFIACQRAGLIFVPVNAALASEDLALIAAAIRPSVIIGDCSRETELEDIAERCDADYVLTTGVDNRGSLNILASDADPEFTDRETMPDSPALLSCTIAGAGAHRI